MVREKQHILSDIVQVAGLMPLPMKSRDKQKWTPRAKRERIRNLKCLLHLSAYITLLIIPGGFFLMPVMARCLDRRRGRRVVPRAG
jgi:hypothetical protein